MQNKKYFQDILKPVAIVTTLVAATVDGAVNPNDAREVTAPIMIGRVNKLPLKEIALRPPI